MQTLNLVYQNNCQFNYKLGKEISSGADGQVFELTDDLNKVIKISVLYDLDFSGIEDLNNKYKKISSILELLKNSNHIFAKVFDYNKIGSFNRDYLRGNQIFKQDYILYSYTMEKCFKLSEDEKKIFHTILSHEDRGIIKNYSLEKLNEILFGLSKGLDFDKKKIILFYESLISSSIKHLDLHPRNIMKDIKGNFKLIDFDRLEFK